MFFFTSKYSWVILCPVLSPTCHELTKQTKMAAWWATISLFRFGFTRKSLDTVSKSKNIQATQQLNYTNEPGDERKGESQPEVFAGKSKRDRKYQTSRERDFPWLVHDDEKNTMKCKICYSFPKIADKSSSLFIGNGAFRRTTIQAHAKSKTRFKCFEANFARENPGAAPMRTVLRNMNAQVNEKLQKLFNSNYFISRENLAFARFPQLCKLQMKNGVDLGERNLN